MIYSQMEILEMKNTTTKIKISVDGLNNQSRRLLSKHETDYRKYPVWKIGKSIEVNGWRLKGSCSKINDKISDILVFGIQEPENGYYADKRNF